MGEGSQTSDQERNSTEQCYQAICPFDVSLLGKDKEQIQPCCPKRNIPMQLASM